MITTNRDSSTKQPGKKPSLSEDEELEQYLKERNSVIGETTKSIRESKEEKALKDYMKVRSKTFDDVLQYDNPNEIKKEEKETSEEDLELYVEQRNKTIGDDVSLIDQDPDLDAYIRQRKEILDE